MDQQETLWNVEFDCPQAQIDKMFTYLDGLRESGITNMFAATPYVVAKFNIPNRAARKVLTYWAQTFAARHPRRHVFDD